jgi:hypothetical protein
MKHLDESWRIPFGSSWALNEDRSRRLPGSQKGTACRVVPVTLALAAVGLALVKSKALKPR